MCGVRRCGSAAEAVFSCSQAGRTQVILEVIREDCNSSMTAFLIFFCYSSFRGRSCASKNKIHSFHLRLCLHACIDTKSPPALLFEALQKRTASLSKSLSPPYFKQHSSNTMAELMFGLGQTKKKKETEAKVKQTKTNLKDVTITETVESNVRSDQWGREKNEKATRTATRQNLKDVNITETVETNARADQFGREKAEKAARTETRKNLKDVLITDTVESGVRKEQHNREKEWTQTGRQQKQNNTNFDMAPALFN
mmetsp:Transcript_32661/g.54716  ORF Transcript_32661/g.54716 Transcript_32661/m.54716 type:complete len:255 (+) Transcript_32661:183-947(+)